MVDEEIKRTRRRTTTDSEESAKKTTSPRSTTRRSTSSSRSRTSARPKTAAVANKGVVEKDVNLDTPPVDETVVEEVKAAPVEEKLPEPVVPADVKEDTPPVAELEESEPDVLVPEKPPAPPRWKKRSGTGNHYMPNGEIISGAGVVIQAWPHELGSGIDKFTRLTPLLPGEVDGGPPSPKATLRVRPSRTDSGKFDVVDGSGKRMNTAPLSKEDAESLVNGV